MPCLCVLFLFLVPVFGQFEVPDALVEVFRPKGLRVSIPDVEGIKLFAFHAKVNEEMNGREGGTFSRDILKPKNGRWTFYDSSAQLKVGDVLYYWTYVDYFDGKNKLGYTKDDQIFAVSELREKESTATDCKGSATVTSTSPNNCQRKLLFSEDFDDLKNSIWTPEIKFAGPPDFEFVLYGNNSKNLAVKDGHLHIRPLPSEDLYGEGFVRHPYDLGASCTGITGTDDCSQTPVAGFILPPVTSAQITTKNKWSFKYGRIEIRAKLPSGDWIYPELYLNPDASRYGPGYSSGQIRVAFTGGNADLARHLRGGCILGDNQIARTLEMKTMDKVGGSWCEGFHNFSVVWSPEQITVSVDGTVYGNVVPPGNGFSNHPSLLHCNDKWQTGTKMAPFDNEMHIAVGVGVGGDNFEDRSDGTKPWTKKERRQLKKFHQAKNQWLPTWGDNSALQVDYIKVWAL